MNIGIITSYVIAGMLLLAILMMNMNMNTSSTELLLTQVTREQSRNISDILSYDVPKIGYNLTSITDTLLIYADSTLLRFKANIDNSTDGSVETVEWEFVDTPVSGSDNPNHKILRRTVDGVQNDITTGVTNFRFQYYDEYGDDLTNDMSTPLSSAELANVKQIYIKLVVESQFKYRSRTFPDGRYVMSVWEKRFSPQNLMN